MKFLSKRKLAFGALVCAALALAVLLWARFAEPSMLTVTRIEIPLRAWAGTEKRVRAVALADPHFGRGPAEEARLARIVEKTLAQLPDVVFLLGDYVNGTRRENMMDAETLAAGLRPLAERVPVIGCLGNHDPFYGSAEIIRALRAVGVRIERRAAGVLALGGGNAEMQIVVTQDSDSYGAVPEIFPECPRLAGTPSVLISHSPDVFALLDGRERRFDFAFCGHTHGGQICLPGGVPIVTSSRIVGRGFAYGLKDVPAGGKMFVSRGLGTSIVPMRLFCPPEIVVAEFVPADAASAE